MNKFFLSLLYVLFATQQYSVAQKQYKIVYNVLEDREKDNYDIYSMNMDGSDKKNITNTPGVEWVYYAYKDKVYYISDKDTCHRCYFLYEMDAEGNNKRKLSALQVEDSWMSCYDIATGNYLLVMGRIGKMVRNQLFRVNITDGTYKQLTDDTVSNKRDPLFIPELKAIVMAYRPDKAFRKTVPDELWKFSFDEKAYGPNPFGKVKAQLTHFPKEDTTTQWFEYHAGPRSGTANTNSSVIYQDRRASTRYMQSHPMEKNNGRSHQAKWAAAGIAGAAMVNGWPWTKQIRKKKAMIFT